MTIYHLFTFASCFVGAGVFRWLWKLESVKPFKYAPVKIASYTVGVMTTDSDAKGLV